MFSHTITVRLGMSNLNYDLYRRHLIEDPACPCGNYAETAEHYLLSCPLFNNKRNTRIAADALWDFSALTGPYPGWVCYERNAVTIQRSFIHYTDATIRELLQRVLTQQ